MLASASLAGVAGVAELASEVLAGGRPAVGRELQGGGGRRFVASARALEHDERRLAAVVAVDVTEHALTDAALRESERTLADAQRMARMGWWVLWPQSGVAVQSPELLELTGMDPARERELSDDDPRRGPAGDRGRRAARLPPPRAAARRDGADAPRPRRPRDRRRRGDRAAGLRAGHHRARPRDDAAAGDGRARPRGARRRADRGADRAGGRRRRRHARASGAWRCSRSTRRAASS